MYNHAKFWYESLFCLMLAGCWMDSYICYHWGCLYTACIHYEYVRACVWHDTVCTICAHQQNITKYCTHIGMRCSSLRCCRRRRRIIAIVGTTFIYTANNIYTERERHKNIQSEISYNSQKIHVYSTLFFEFSSTRVWFKLLLESSW